MKTTVYHATSCPTCGSAPSKPFRTYNAGRIVQGCIDHFHTGHLVAPSASNTWHFRPEAKALRAKMRAARLGGVTEYAHIAGSC